MIKIAVVYEGLRDTDAVRVIISRIIESEGIEFEISKMVPTHKGIIGYVKAYVRTFFDLEGLHVGVFLTDQDVKVDVDDRRRKIRQCIEEVNPTHLNYSAIGVADPHFEKWLVSDHNLLKKIMRLNGSDPIPFSDKLPKHQLELLKRNMSLPQPTLNEIYLAISNEINPEEIGNRCPDFRLFKDDLITACRNAQRLMDQKK